MAGIVRSSKYRHIFGNAYKTDKCYHDLKVTKDSADSNFCAVNPKFLAAVTIGSGGGPFFVIPLDQVGRLPTDQPFVNGHGQKVIDLAWSPFNDNVLASCSEDCTVKIWEIPDGGLLATMTEPYLTLNGHERKVTLIVWHPTADNILISGGADNKILLWNIEAGDCIFEMRLPDIPFSLSWNYDGSLVACTCKDKKLRVIDIRKEEFIQEGDCFDGSKPSKCVFLRDGKIFATGFSRMSQRLIALFDEKLNKLTTLDVDSASGTVYPFYDPDTSVVFTVGKGDTAIKYYEVVDEKPYVHFLSVYSSTKSQRGVGWMPKRGCDVRACEIARFYKLEQDNTCEVVQMIVPRKSDLFQHDIFPPFATDEPALSADDWIAGANAPPRTGDWEPVFESCKSAQTTKKSNKPQRALSKVSKSAKMSVAPSEAVQNGATVPPGVNLEELVDDVKKLKATVRKLTRRVSALEKQLGEVIADEVLGDDGEEEE